MYNTFPYIVKNITNLHVGSGNTNYGIVDKEIQRDTAGNLPIIHASSLKGALREHMTRNLKASNSQEDGNGLSCAGRFKLRIIFGAEGNDQTQEDQNTDRQEEKPPCMEKIAKLPEQGMMRFYDARLVFVPMRSDVAPFFHVTSIGTLRDAFQWLDSLGIENLSPLPDDSESTHDYIEHSQKAFVEDFECKPMPEELKQAVKPIKELFGIDRIAVMSEESFQTLLDSLPVIARNKLDNGKSINLWYEEVLPRQSVLLTAISQYELLDPSDEKDFEKAYKKLHDTVQNDLIQVGANASIGYGLCRFNVLGDKR